MRSSIIIIAVISLSLGFIAGLADSSAQARADAKLMIGAAKADITPTEPIRLGGYAVRKGPSVGTQQRIWAKALAIGGDPTNASKSADGAAILVTVDALGVPVALVAEIADRLKRKTGLDPNRLAIGASHTHSAPCLAGVAPNLFGMKLPDDQQGAIDRYTKAFADAVETACLRALADRKPGRLVWTKGQAGFAANRRTPGGPVDHDLPMIAAQDETGRLLAIVTNYACHCTTQKPEENLVSGDWAGDAQELIEQAHPGAIAMTLVGCGADSNPQPRLSREACRSHGQAIADEVKRRLPGPTRPLDGPIRAAVKRIALAFDDLPTRDQLQALIQAGGYPGYNARTHLERLDRDGKLPDSIPDYPVQVWEFGDDLAMVFLGGEVVVDYSLRLKRELDPSRLWTSAYSNAIPGYIPSERILKEGGYEGGGAMVYFGHPTRFRPGLENQIISAVKELISPGFLNPNPNANPAKTEQAQAQAQAADDPEMPPPLSAEDSLRSIRVKPGLKVELVAKEPMVLDPIAIDFGADGSLWVCEMRDYPTGIDRDWKPGGTVRLLRDRDGDGRYDQATVFAKDLPFPTGVTAWRKGALICAAPDIIYAEDRDGDDQADVKTVLYTGFSTENYQARINSLHYGFDNWLYGANGLFGGSIRSTSTGATVTLGARDLRIRPDTGAIEPESGLTQQGRTRDDWGNEFGAINGMLVQQYPFPERYAARNRAAAGPHPIVVVPRDPDPTRLYPASRTLARYNDPHLFNRVTSASGPAIYRDDLLGSQYKGNAFVCEPTHNIVHREVLTPDSVTFAGRRPEDEKASEFLASTDHWFRPAEVRNGPDGALYVVDMYRFVIEHPRWISPEQLAKLDVRAGEDKGRIYRIVPEDGQRRPVPRLDKLDAAQLAERLDSPNGVLRDMAQRLLVERGDKGAVPILERLAKTSERPETRAHAYWTLEGLGALSADRVLAALGDPHPQVRRQAARLSEPRLANDERLGTALVRLTQDPDLTVRYQAALSLGEWSDPRAGQALGALAATSNDRWLLAAAASSSASQPDAVLARLLQDRPDSPLLASLTATVAASGSAPRKAAALKSLLGEPGQANAIGASRLLAIAKVLESIPDLPSDVLTRVRTLARDRLDRERTPIADRKAAVAILRLGLSQHPEDMERIGRGLDPRESSEIQLAAIEALATDDRGIARIWGGWPRFSPSVRESALNALLSRPSSSSALLAAVGEGRIAASELGAARRQRLLEHNDPAIRDRAAKTLGEAGKGQASANRQSVVAAYRGKLPENGDSVRGSAAFDRACGSCHAFGGQGHEVGPDLAALTDRSTEALLAAVLDPNRELDARYSAYAIELNDGRVLNGLITAETGGSLTIKQQHGKTDVVPRAEIAQIKAGGKSLMPEGLEQDLDPADLMNVIAYLRQGAAAPKTFAGNRPESAKPDADGSIRLKAAHAAIFGPSLVFEPEWSNLGYWHSADDRAEWTFEAKRSGVHTVSIEWACADESAGNALIVQCEGQTIRRLVGGTGGWSRYRTIFLGELKLEPGTHHLTVKSGIPPQGALLDLRSLIVTPRGLIAVPEK